MNIIRKEPGQSGAYSPIINGSFTSVPDGCALWPDTLDTSGFYAYSGFATLTIEAVGEVDTVTAYEPNVEAWEAWKASLPPEVEVIPEPTVEERVTTLEEQLAEAEEAAIELYEANLIQEEINAQQDEAFIEVYEAMEAVNAEQDEAIIQIYETMMTMEVMNNG